MKNTIKKFFAGITIVSFVLFSQAMAAEAATGQYFGGRASGLIPCTGSGSTVQTLTIFFPLYLNNSTPMGGFLGTPSSIQYSNYYVTPKSSALGTYQSGAATCIIGSCPYCVYIPNYGLILSSTGASI